MKKKYYEGYLTIEASFIIPVALMILSLLLYWGFYCYDKSVSVQCSYLAVLRGSNEWDLTSGELEQSVTRQLEKLMGEAVLYTRMEEADVSVGLLNIEAKVQGGMDILFSKLRGDDMTRWEMDTEKSAYRLKPASFIRKYHFLGE